MVHIIKLNKLKSMGCCQSVNNVTPVERIAPDEPIPDYALGNPNSDMK